MRLTAESAEGVEMGRQRAADRALGDRGGIRGGVDTRETCDPGAKRAVALLLDDDGKVLRRSPSSLRMRRARPAPTSFLVWTATVITRPLSWCTN